MTGDAAAWPLLGQLADYLEQEITAAGVPVPRFLGVLPAGSVVPLDWCGPGDSGQAWVRLINMFPSSRFPGADADLDNCNSPMAFNLEVGIMRCGPMPTGAPPRLVLPTAEAYLAAAELQAADMRVMRRTLRCALAKRDAVLGTFNPHWDGSTVGGVWPAVVSENF